VALARAVYHRGDITLIDDALSAVDAHVAKQLFNEAIVDELLTSDTADKKRSVVLVTNALQYLNHPRVDRIVVIQEGRVIEEGSYSALASKSDSVFARFLAVLEETSVSGSLTEGSDVPAKTSSRVTTSSVKFTERTSNSQSLGHKSKKLISEETRRMGHVGLEVYYLWIRAAGGIIVAIVVILLFAAVEGVGILSNWWLTYWSSHADAESQVRFLSVYALINVSAALAGLVRMLLISYFSLRASRKVSQRRDGVANCNSVALTSTSPSFSLVFYLQYFTPLCHSSTLLLLGVS
jgi:ATP-binding cassette subfamily C (CFTR/MRP) protein 1